MCTPCSLRPLVLEEPGETLDLTMSPRTRAGAIPRWAVRLPALSHNYNYYTLVCPGLERKLRDDAVRDVYGGAESGTAREPTIEAQG